MAAHAITLHLPSSLYARLEQRAEAAKQDLEAVMLRIVAEALPAKEENSRSTDKESWEQYAAAAATFRERSPTTWTTQDVIDEIRR